jgi:hypothetical protein
MDEVIAATMCLIFMVLLTVGCLSDRAFNRFLASGVELRYDMIQRNNDRLRIPMRCRLSKRQYLRWSRRLMALLYACGAVVSGLWLATALWRFRSK